MNNINELRTLIKKVINEELTLNEYDRGGFNDKYQNLPKDRIDNINKYSIERQKLNGIAMVLKDDANEIAYITPKDINFNVSGDFDIKFNDKDFFSKMKVNDKKHFYTEFRVSNTVFVGAANEGDYVLNFVVGGELTKLTDKERPDLKCNVTHIKCLENFIPQTQKDNIRLNNRIKDVLIEKYSNRGLFPYFSDVVIDRNAIYRF